MSKVTHLLTAVILCLSLAACNSGSDTAVSAASTASSNSQSAAVTNNTGTDQQTGTASSVPSTLLVDASEVLVLKWADDVMADLTVYDSHSLDSSGGEVGIAFLTGSSLTNVRFFSITLNSMDDQGKADYEKEEVYQYGTLNADKPLVVYMTFYGDVFPNYAIGYTDPAGTEHLQGLTISGMDGSLQLIDLN